MVARDDLDYLHRATQTAVRGAQEELAAFMRKAASWPPDDLRDGLIKVMQAIVTKYGDVAASAAAEWYQQVRADALPGQSYTPVTASAPPPAQVEGSVRAAAGHLYQGDPAMTERVLAGALQRYVTDQSRGTVAANALRDPKARRFARVPQGKTCAWCALLASRGFVYTTAHAAGKMNHYHDDCDCQIVPGFSDDPPSIDGYDPDALYRFYIAARHEAERKRPGVTLTDRDIAAKMRTLYPGRYSDGVGKHGSWSVGRTSGLGRGWRKGLRKYKSGFTKDSKPFGAWPGGKPEKFGGVRAYESLDKTPRIPTRRRSFADQVGNVNPNYNVSGQWPVVFGERPYNVNCVRCSTALALRRLGYDVQAGAGSYMPASLNGAFNNTDEAVSRWKRDGKTVELWQSRTRLGDPSDTGTLKELRRQQDGAFGVIRASWERGGGHVWNWEIVNGELTFWDGQIGQQVPVDSRLALTKKGTIMWARLDNATPTDNLLDVVSIPEPEAR